MCVVEWPRPPLLLLLLLLGYTFRLTACTVVCARPCLAAAVYYFAENFMLWSTFQAGVMLVQNRYQRRRMYTRIALGKNSAMDVVSGESSGSAGQLLLLYPLLFSELTLSWAVACSSEHYSGTVTSVLHALCT